MVSLSEPLYFVDHFQTTSDIVGAGAKVRKHSSISYVSPGSRDSREKKRRPLVVVIPPTILLHQHGPLGHTLSLGSPQRLAQGIIMTLHPTMYAQLTAISREFNFPSTSGLCLYLRHIENGITLTPRISDESWSSLWGPAFECQSSKPTVPITGTIEFDIDLRQAKWYSSWLSSSSRTAFDLHHSTCSRTVTSERSGDSRTFVSDEQLDNYRDTYLHYPPSSVSLRRPPKKLSLVDRLDMTSPKPLPPSSSPSPEKAHLVSPFTQKSEPQSAGNNLNIKSSVQSRRTGSALEFTPVSMVAADQISLDPASVPNTMQIDASLGLTDILNMAEYSYSITPAGPEDLDSLATDSPERQPPIQLDYVLRSSVNSTPSIPFVPLDYDFDSNIGGIDYIPSSDLATRAVESIALAPMTATSWGPVLSSPSTPWGGSYTASLDINDKHIFSTLLSATTATSWRDPLSDYPSPLAVSVLMTPDVGYCATDDTLALRPYPYLWPYYLSQMASLDNQSRYPCIKIYTSVRPSVCVYPELAEETLGKVHLQTADDWTNRIVSVYLSQYPSFNLYPPLYPSFNIYPTLLRSIPISDYKATFCAESYPISSEGLTLTSIDTLPYYPTKPEALQSLEVLETRFLSVHFLQYPIFDLYPATYPHLNLYPTTVQTNCLALSTLVTEVPLARVFSVCNYPTLVIYPPVYPHFNLFPSYLQAVPNFQISAADVSLVSESTEIYPAAQVEVVVNVMLNTGYPMIVLYPAVYPHFNIYPILGGRLVDLTCASTPPSSDPDVTAVTDTLLKSRYPTNIPYPPLYPHLNLYPVHTHYERSVNLRLANNLVCSDAQDTGTIGNQLKPSYPTIILYPALYPHFDIYPNFLFNEQPCILTTESGSVHWDTQITKMMDSPLKIGYPTINPYPASYPHFNIYPAVLELDERLSNMVSAIIKEDCLEVRISSVVDVQLKPGYPTIPIYPAVYPHVEIYPRTPHRWTLTLDAQYPCFYPYPTVNENFCAPATLIMGSC